MKILTVEDNNMIREGISEYLSEFGDTVIQAIKMEEKPCQI
ncbi:hypothetical protein [Alloscardovia sp. HMSC034E08]